MEQSLPFVLNPLEDDDEISLLEYFLQLSFYTTDLHITNCWSLCTKDEFDSFKNSTSKEFGGSLVSFLSDMNNLEPPQSFENSSSSKLLNIDFEKQLFEYGVISPPSGFQANPTGTFRMLLFKASLGRVYSYSPDSKTPQQEFVKMDFPSGFNTLELVVNSNPKRFNSLYRFSNSSQVLLYAAVEFEFTPLKVQVPDPVCEMCESSMAKWYCHSDRAHFCDVCDMKQHSSTRIFSRHVRIPCSKSPNQFGLCEQHPTDVVDMVCLKCCTLLCNNCILFGKHSEPSFFDHPLMSTLDTYDLSLEKNSDSDEKLKFRKTQISEKIKTRHNSTSQIYANSKGVEDKIDYCKKMILNQLDEMKSKKMNYLNSIKREVNTQIKLIDWMQSFLHHLLLSLEPCQFIMFKKRYDLLVKKYFTKDLADYLQFPIWMGKELTLVGDAIISSSSVRALSRSFSNASNQSLDSTPLESNAQPEINSNDKLLDWTPLNMYEDFNETVGRVTKPSTDKSDPDVTSNQNNIGSTKLVNKSPNELDVLDTATKLWHYLSDFKMGTLIQLLKVVEVPDRSLLVRHLLNLSNHFEQLGTLFNNISNFEMNNSLNDFGYCVLLRSSGVLGDILSFLFCSDYSTKENSDFLNQLTYPLDHHFNLYLNSNTDNEDVLNEMVDNCMVEIVFKLVSLDVSSLPTSFQFVLYSLSDLFLKLKVDYRSYVVVDFFCSVLSTYLLRYLNHYNLSDLFTNFNTKSDTDPDMDEKYNKFKQFVRELSYKFGRAAIVIWELDSVTHNESYELKQSQKIFDWCQNVLSKPRQKTKLLLKSVSSQELDEGCTFVLSQVSKFERKLNSGGDFIPFKDSKEFTKKYNFMHLFRMANQIPI
ncbi:uncharacterized protein TA08630 [Theileria annulata]|uniref:B box-type domain-containing protein n=1 Tax=Theileria annulata TaxID=5874 RepID=Q4U9J2_THEAN|nr:uncharacterized protein TA08630 [Theileria annulata]CAI76511.1 hypothetical protein, conserved [Theileria annulata]|eukprot:XP_953136.1 hypothetical protein, conserved [Theileria annulata]